MLKSFVILWLESYESGIYELDFARDFCKRKTEELTGVKVFSCNWESTVYDVWDVLRDKKCFFVVCDPYLVISSYAGKVLVESVLSCKNSVVGPVFNHSEFSHQMASLEFSYVDSFTFEEVAGLLSKQNSFEEVKILDPSCFSCSVESIGDYKYVKLADLVDVLPFKFVAKGALVHSFRKAFSSSREDLLDILPEGVETVLDVGCAEGMFGKMIIDERKALVVDGVEVNPVFAEKAERFYRKLFVGRFETVKIEDVYDVVHMGDVLEHVYDPWRAVAKVKSLLKPGGCFTGSVPNVSHWSVVRQLLSGDFEYIPAGLLCVSHIRFFTPKSLKKLLEEAGFVLDVYDFQELIPTPLGESFINDMTSTGWGNERFLRTAGILFRARKKFS